MSRRVTILVVAALACVQLVGAQVVDDTQFFPIVARTAGAGDPPTQWVTDLVVHNLEDVALEIGLLFFPANQANTLDFSFPDRITLQARETRMVEDVLEEVFGYTSNVTGALLITCAGDLMPGSGNPEECEILGTTRTYNVGSPEGTFGQTIPNNDWMMNASMDPSFVVGARNDDDFRSNLGVVNISLQEVTVHYRMLGINGSAHATGSIDVPSLTVVQRAFKDLGVGKVAGPITVQLWLDPADVTPLPCSVDMPNMFVAYVSKVDGNPQGTGDAEFLYAAPVNPLECED